jgi:hypothetical protein
MYVVRKLIHHSAVFLLAGRYVNLMVFSCLLNLAVANVDADVPIFVKLNIDSLTKCTF